MANIQINQLPTAGAITGQELVPIQQNGVTVQTTTAAISASPSQTQTFLTVGLQTTLPNSRYFSTGAGLGITDGGAQGAYTIAFNGTAASLEASGTGFVVKTAADTITPRSIATSGNGISVTDGDGIAGNPTFQLTGLAQAIANASGTGLLALGSGTTLSPVTLTGTSNQIGVTGGDGSATPTISLANNFIAPGTAGITLPNGTTAQRGATTGQIRYNTDTARFEGYYAGSWQTFGIGDGAVTSVSGTTSQIDVTNVGSIATVAIAANPTIPGTAGVVIPVGTTAQRTAAPTNGILRYNTTLAQFEAYTNGAWSVLSTGSTGVTSVATGVGLLGGPITTAGTIDIDTTVVATLTGTQTLTNKTISGASNTLSNIGNSSLTNSAITIGSNSVSLGSTLSTLNGVSISGSANTLSSIGNSSLTNSSLTLGTTTVSLGATATSLAGLSSVAVTGNPTTALELTTKQYVDNIVASGVSYHTPVRLESPNTAGNLSATYNNGTAGVGATLTNAGTQVALTVDGVATVVNDRVLIYNQTNAVENGVYTVTDIGSGSTNWVLTRATDANSYGVGANALDEGSAFFVTSGNTGAGETYVCNTSGTITFGTTPITFAQISSVQVYTAGTGLTLTGTQFSLTTPVTAALGGTGQSSYTTGDLIYASGTTALSKLAAGTNGYLLTMNAGLPTWQPAPATGVTTFDAGTTGLTPSTATSGAVTLAGILSLANGGTNASLTAVAGAVPYSTASAIALTAAGTAGQVLQSNGSSAPTWVTPAGGVTLANDTTTASNLYPTFAAATSGSVSTIYTGNANLLYKPSTGELQSTALVASNGIVVNSATVSANYTIASGNNAVSAGPITISAGVVVTVASGSVWAIV
jgi:hypothetical protein